jgi:hypothetical protein
MLLADILLSLVRSKAVGHLRDVRRLVVAMSRARLGLYVFGRAALFQNCYELSTTFGLLLAKSTKLQIVPGETYPTERQVRDGVGVGVGVGVLCCGAPCITQPPVYAQRYACHRVHGLFLWWLLLLFVVAVVGRCIAGNGRGRCLDGGGCHSHG